MSRKSRQKNDPQALLEEERLRQQEAVATAYEQGVINLLDFIAPPSLEFFSTYFRLGTTYCRTSYVFDYPREIYSGWLGQVVTLPQIMDIALHIYPVETTVILKNLRRKTTQLEASISLDHERGRVRDPAKEAQLLDTEDVRDRLQMGSERFFRFGFYYTIYSPDLDELEIDHKRVESMLNRQLVYSKPASAQQEEAFNSATPLAADHMMIRRNMNTGALGTTFPFISSNLTQENGILYGINLHNSSLVIFDRFSLENSNSVVLSEAGGGKSFAVKLEALRLMMLGVEVIIIDPENEYQRMAEAVGGSYINLSLSSPHRINPFNLPKIDTPDPAEDALRNHLIDLHGLLRLMLGGIQATGTGRVFLTPNEEADLDAALIDTYAKVGITRDPLTHNSVPPTIANLYDTLTHMGGSGPLLAQRLKKYMSGTFAGLFSEQSNITMDNQLVVFNIRDLEDEIRPIAMYMVLNFIWDKTRSDQKKRILIVDEAWQIMKYEDSANFMFGLTKRARKYHLGITNITQDVEDFTSSRLGRSIIANSSMQLLLKQSSSSVDLLSDIFKLTANEKKLLNQFPVGTGLFFAGRRHVEIQILASKTEHDLITTSPDELLALQQKEAADQPSEPPTN